MADELLDLVNEKDEAIGTVMKQVAHAEGKRIRIIHVFIFDSQGRMAVQLRGPNVRFKPGYWVTAGSGHVKAGESYQTAGARELREEMGIEVPLTFEGAIGYRDELGHEEFLGVMRGTYDGAFTVHPDDVERIEYFSMEKIQDMVRKNDKLHPEFLFLLQQKFGMSV